MTLLTVARDLRRRKGREKRSLFVSEGVRAVEELLRSPLVLRGVLVAPQLEDAPRGAALRASLQAKGGGVETVEISAREFASACETDSPQGVLAIAEIPSHGFASLDLADGARVLVLDAVQDPGNVGTIVRAAAALGAAATVALPGTVDLWNAKVIRAAMGAHFHYPVFHATTAELFAFLERSGCALWGSDASGEQIRQVAAPVCVALAVGNEGAGLSAEVRDRCDRVVSIGIDPKVESLNVAVAAGIILHALAR